MGNALSKSKVCKLQELDLYNNKIGPDGAKAIAAFCAVSGSITSVRCPPGVELIHCPSCFLILLLEYNTILTLSWRSIVSAA